MNLKRLVTASAALALLLTGGCLGSSNFASCILDRMPGVQNDAAAHAVMQVCKQSNPDVFFGAKQGSWRGWFGYASGPECAAKKASATRSQRAGSMIYRACRCLYDAPDVEGISCGQQQGLLQSSG